MRNGWMIEKMGDYMGGWRVMRQIRPGDAAGWEALRSVGGRVGVLSGCLEQMEDEATRYPSREAAEAAVELVS